MADGIFTFTKRVVANLDEAVRFYRQACGFNEQTEVRATVGGRGIVEIVLKSSSLAAPPLVLISVSDAPQMVHGDSILAFYTSDLEAFVQRICDAGGSIVQTAESLPKLGVRLAYLRDSGGHLIEVLQKM